MSSERGFLTRPYALPTLYEPVPEYPRKTWGIFATELSSYNPLRNFECESKPHFLGGPNLFVCNNIWLPKENAKENIKFFQKTPSILGHQTTVAIQSFDEFCVNESETYG